MLHEAQWVARFPVRWAARLPELVRGWGDRVQLLVSGTLVVEGWRPERKRATTVRWEPEASQDQTGGEDLFDLEPWKWRTTLVFCDRPDATLWRVGVELLDYM